MTSVTASGALSGFPDAAIEVFNAHRPKLKVTIKSFFRSLRTDFEETVYTELNFQAWFKQLMNFCLKPKSFRQKIEGVAQESTKALVVGENKKQRGERKRVEKRPDLFLDFHAILVVETGKKPPRNPSSLTVFFLFVFSFSNPAPFSILSENFARN